MALSRLRIRNFQSIKQLDLDLAPLTVIVGPSNSGKSALLRAVKILISNSRGTAWITEGEKQSSIAAQSNGFVVELQRGTKNEYSVRLPDAEGLAFTKLAGGVPAEVTAALGVEPVKDSSLNFAGQFDPPYLVDMPGAQVARVLGALTNVTIILEAAREANRAKGQAASELKTRESDLVGYATKIAQYASLPQRLVAIAEAEQAATEVSVLETRVSLLRSALAGVASTRAAVAQAKQTLDAQSTPVDINVGDVQALISTREGIFFAMHQVSKTSEMQVRAWSAWGIAKEEEARRAQELQDFFRSLGSCPLCGAEQEHMHPEHV